MSGKRFGHVNVVDIDIGVIRNADSLLDGAIELINCRVDCDDDGRIDRGGRGLKQVRIARHHNSRPGRRFRHLGIQHCEIAGQASATGCVRPGSHLGSQQRSSVRSVHTVNTVEISKIGGTNGQGHQPRIAYSAPSADGGHVGRLRATARWIVLQIDAAFKVVKQRRITLIGLQAGVEVRGAGRRLSCRVGVTQRNVMDSLGRRLRRAARQALTNPAKAMTMVTRTDSKRPRALMVGNLSRSLSCRRTFPQ